MRLSDVYLPIFYNFHNAYKKDYTFYILKGGRGSGKSAQIAIELILDLMINKVSALAVRKIGNTLGLSVYETLLWAIEELGVSDYWTTRGTKTEGLLLTYKPWGNHIYFRGSDNPKKIKSIKDHKYPIARLWMEEVDEFRIEEEVDTITNSIIREELTDLTYKIILSYNPPKRKHSWINKRFESKLIPEHYYIHTSDYTTNKYMSKQFIAEAEHIKMTNKQRYDWEYLGMAIGSGVVPFSNLIFERITDEQIKTFDNIRNGLDWGYAADPLGYGRMHYDKTRRRLYIFDEYYKIQCSNEEIANWIKTRGYQYERIIADSSEPKSIANLKKDYGIINITGAKKGPGSVESGEKWLNDLEAIIIDPVRCPNAAREFENIDYETDKDGNIKNRLVDKDNHFIDLTRYACSEDMVTRSTLSRVKPTGW